MQSRETRFTLRIESGERTGEVLDLPEGTLVVGRRPDCGLVLKDASVSGRHAEVHVQNGEVEVVDLGSTNGTRKEGHKIDRARLGHGDAVLFGSVKVVLHDATLDGTGPGPATATVPTAIAAEPLPAPAVTDGGALGRVSADKLKRSSAGSRKFPVVLVVVLVLAAGGAGAWRMLQGRNAVGPVRVVPTVPGNLLTDGSFEEGTEEWATAETAPQVFSRDRAYVRSGDVGLGATLEAAGDWSLARSPELTVPARRRIELTGEVRSESGLASRLGLELSSSDGTGAPFIAWTPALGESGDFTHVALGFDALGGYDRARVVVAAQGSGSVALDDVAVVEAEPRGNVARFNEYELVVLGEPGSTAVLVRSGRALLGGLDLSSWNRNGLEGWPSARLEAVPGPRGFHLRFPGAPADAVLYLQALRTSAATGAGESRWIATTGAEGYAAHGDAFTRDGVTSLLFGSGLELLRLGFERPVEVNCTHAGSGYQLRVALHGLEECELQLTFGEERAEATSLAERAEQRERAGEPGVALQVWNELLDRFPFERALVTRAEAARGRLVETGLAEVDGIRRGLDRARFFALPELFREGRDGARKLAHQYEGTEVGQEAQAAADVAQAELAALHAGDQDSDSRLLRGVLQALDPTKAPRLSGHVQSVLQDVDLDSVGD